MSLPQVMLYNLNCTTASPCGEITTRRALSSTPRGNDDGPVACSPRLMSYRVALVVVLLVGCKEAPKPKQGAFVPVLAQLIANPLSQKPKSTRDEKDATTYSYDDVPKLGIRHLEMVVAKDRPKAWRFTFESSGGPFSPYNFGPADGVTTMSMPDGWDDIYGPGAPLFGALVHILTPTTVEIVSPPFLLSPRGNQPDMVAWACDSGRGGVKASLDDFRGQCRSLVKQHLTIPSTADFPILTAGSDQVSKDCGRLWASTVESKNAFGVVLKHGFVCTYVPKTNRVDVSMSGK